MVTYLPSLPANGPSLTRKFIVIVGSSIVSSGRIVGSAIDVIVSPTLSSAMPVNATMSPARASASSKRLRPWKPSTFWTRNSSCLPSRCASSTRSPTLLVPGAHAADRHVAEVVVVVERRDLHAAAARRGRRPAAAPSRRSGRAAAPRSFALVAEVADRRSPRGPRRRSPGSRAARRWRRARRTGRTPASITCRAGSHAGAIDLVDDDDRPQAQRRTPSA